MKKLFSIMAVAVGLFAGYTTYNAQQNTELTDIALANVEALADDSDKKEIGYSVTHMKCFKRANYGGEYVLIETGKCSAFCWEVENGRYPYHNHACSDCCYVSPLNK